MNLAQHYIFRPHSVYKLRLIAADGVAWSVCLCVSVGHVHWPCKKTEPIEMQIRGQTREGPRKLHVLNEGRDPPREGAFFVGCPTHWTTLRISATALYAAKKTYKRRQRNCGSSVQCSRLVCVILRCLSWKICSLWCGLSRKFFETVETCYIQYIFRIANNTMRHWLM